MSDFDITFRVLVTGARKWKSQVLSLVLEDYRCEHGPRLRVAQGMEKTGIDWQTHQWCLAYGVIDWGFPALWDEFRAAGLNYKWAGNHRNGVMRIYVQPHVVCAFHWDLRQSKGTKDMIDQARRWNIPVCIFTE